VPLADMKLGPRDGRGVEELLIVTGIGEAREGANGARHGEDKGSKRAAAGNGGDTPPRSPHPHTWFAERTPHSGHGCQRRDGLGLNRVLNVRIADSGTEH